MQTFALLSICQIRFFVCLIFKRKCATEMPRLVFKVRIQHPNQI